MKNVRLHVCKWPRKSKTRIVYGAIATAGRNLWKHENIKWLCTVIVLRNSQIHFFTFHGTLRHLWLSSNWFIQQSCCCCCYHAESFLHVEFTSTQKLCPQAFLFWQRKRRRNQLWGKILQDFPSAWIQRRFLLMCSYHLQKLGHTWTVVIE